MKSRGRQPRLLFSALPSLTAITTTSLCYCARGFLVVVILIGSLYSLQGGVPKQVLHRPGLQVPPLHLRQHPGWEVWGLTSDNTSPSVNVTYLLRICAVLNSDFCVWCSFRLPGCCPHLPFALNFEESKSGTSTQKLLFIHSFLRKIALTVMCFVLVKSFCFTCVLFSLILFMQIFPFIKTCIFSMWQCCTSNHKWGLLCANSE